MRPLGLDDITDQRAYEREREARRAEIIELKRLRRVAIGPIVSAVFENRATMRHQIQEMARAEKLTTDEQILAELAVYNPLVPGPGELSMTLFIELTEESALRKWLPELLGIERSVELVLGPPCSQLRLGAAVEPSHGAQLTRETTTAAVHYVKIFLDGDARRRFAAEPARIAIVHPSYRHETVLSMEQKASLIDDWSEDQES